MLFQLRAQCFGDIRHLGERLRAPHVDPVPELLHAHLALALGYSGLAEARGKFRARQADQRRLRRRHIGLQRRFLDENAARLRNR
jgi:hypothetical protein